MIHYEEIDKSSPENLPNFNNLLATNIESGNDNFNYKKSTSQPARLEILKDMRK